MPKKKSIKGSANEFKAETDKILAFLTASAGLGDEHVSWCHDLAIIRLYRAFESLMLDALVGALNNDTSTLSSRTGFTFPKHLTDEVCRFLVTGRGYFDFKGRDGLIRALKQYLPDAHYLITVVSKQGYRDSLDLLTAARNYAAHESQQSKAAFKKATGQNRVGAAGSWLKRQNRFGKIADKLKAMADEIHAAAPY
ncbi:MAG TPA: hypothetical protein PKC60_12320 [Hydrogenophaga sp.]|uniref:hypothetical protein n=1 Tax=Hydrogenophaga sp. TaxID=1904254 RepID=UPI002C8BA6EB|nr:hypothetical protein [Hydrogenophaga sp.]HMN94005.1 hypothetical protein [Hydrogenophaga sp.]HMP12198.1 hypothetical protein [Hydrogenophaga sp.]